LLGARVRVGVVFPRRITVGVKSLREWLAEGEQLYGQALAEYQNLQAQLEQLERALTAKRGEVNQIAQVIGKSPPAEQGKRLSAQLIEADAAPTGAVTRALTGRGLGLGRA
jgi:hypothetical protein